MTVPTLPSLLFVGTGEAFDPDLPNVSMLYRGDRSVLLDCGFSVPPALWRHTRDPNDIDAIWVSHQHADHSFGLAPLLVWMRVSGRQKPMEILGGPGTEAWLWPLLDIGYPGALDPQAAFPIHLRTIAPGTVERVGLMNLRTALTEHMVNNFAVRIDEGNSALFYSGDGAATEESLALMTGCTEVVHECYSAGSLRRGHTSAEELVPAVAARSVQHLSLVHVGAVEKAGLAKWVTEWRGALPVTVPTPGFVSSCCR